MGAESQIKKHIHAPLWDARVLFPRGFHAACAEEIERILSSPTVPQKHKPEIADGEDGDIAVVGLGYRTLVELSLRLKTARDVLWTVEKGRAASAAEVAKRAARVPWALILPEGATVAIRCRVRKSRFPHEGKVAELVARVLEQQGFRSSDKGEQLLDIRLIENQLHLSLSVSGHSPLAHRGYKTELHGSASIREDLAACLLVHTSGASADRVIVPFAGSGTFGFEAVLLYSGLPASLLPKAPVIAHWLCTPAATVRHIEKALRERAASLPVQQVHFSDIDPLVCATLRRNVEGFRRMLEAAGFPIPEMKVETADFLTASLADGPHEAYLPLNPPYGRRLGDRTVRKLFPAIGKRLAALAKGRQPIRGFVLLPDEGAARELVRALTGLTATTTPIIHGGRSVMLVELGARMTKSGRI